MEHEHYPSSILSYINEETQTFHEKPFGFLDGFVYSLCSYFLFENSRAANSTTPFSFEKALGSLSNEDLADLFWFNDIAPLFREALLASPRYAPSRAGKITVSCITGIVFVLTWANVFFALYIRYYSVI